MNEELYKKFRPRSLKVIEGQAGAVASISKMMEKGQVPHAVLLTGPSGCGKTTIARILKQHLECGDNDFMELNCADFRGIDMVRDVRRNMMFAPITGKVRMWLIDEAHRLTGEAQDAFLKMLEDTPDHVYFVLCTTNPQKLIKTIHTRCSEVKLSALDAPALQRCLQRVITKAALTVEEQVIEEIIEAADGSARKALVILEQVASLEGAEAQLKAIQTTTFNKDTAVDLARELMFPKLGWVHVAKLLRSLQDQDVEGIRYCILGYARSCMIGKDDKPPNIKLGARAFKIIDIFSRAFYDSKQAGLAAACWEVTNS